MNLSDFMGWLGGQAMSALHVHLPQSSMLGINWAMVEMDSTIYVQLFSKLQLFMTNKHCWSERAQDHAWLTHGNWRSMKMLLSAGHVIFQIYWRRNDSRRCEVRLVWWSNMDYWSDRWHYQFCSWVRFNRIEFLFSGVHLEVVCKYIRIQCCQSSSQGISWMGERLKAKWINIVSLIYTLPYALVNDRKRNELMELYNTWS